MSQKEKQQLLIYTLSLTIHQKSPAHSKQPTRDVSPSRPVNPFQHAPSPQGGRLPPELGLKIPGRKDRPGEGRAAFCTPVPQPRGSHQGQAGGLTSKGQRPRPWPGQVPRRRTRATSQLRAVTWRTLVPGPADTHKGHASLLMGSRTCRRETSELSPRAASLSTQRQGGKGVRAGRQPGSRFWGEGQECDSFLRQDRPLHVPHQRPAGSPPPRAQGRPSPHPKHLRAYKARRRFAPNSGLVT